MQIYYCDAYNIPDVEASSPIEATEAEAQNVFSRIHHAGSFIGIVLGADKVFQMFRKPGGSHGPPIHAEILDRKNLTIRYCELNTPLAELLIEAAFRNEDFEEKIAFARLEWNDEALPRPNSKQKP